MTFVHIHSKTSSLLLAHRVLLPLTIAGLFLSAALLFAVQPMFTRMVLPILGGSPAVWSVVTVLFQSVLLAGYAYAHWLVKIVGTRRATLIQLVVMLLATVVLPIALPTTIGLEENGSSIAWLVGQFLLSIAAPFFALAANGPLLQAWFAKSGHKDGEDPYHLYAASNFGSFFGLLSYPILIEPRWGLVTQSALWSTGFAFLAVVVGLCGVIASFGIAKDVERPTIDRVRVPIKLLARWVGLAFIPSALLVAVTAHLSSDIAATPFLWVVPLAIFLLTFVLTFRKTVLVSDNLLYRLQLAMVGMIVIVRLFSLPVGLVGYVILDLTLLFVAAMAAHSALVALRPAKERLTLFYLAMSLGGVMGGCFTALVAPILFSTVAEFPIALILGLATPLIAKPIGAFKLWPSAGLGVIGGAVVAIGLYGLPDIAGFARELILIACFGLTIALFTVASRSWAVGLAAAIVLLFSEAWLSPLIGKAESIRSFYGVHRIVDSSDGRFRLLFHGTTLHGARRIATEQGEAIKDAPPAMYYHPDSPFADAIEVAQIRNAQPRVSVVGLGAGALAWYGRNQEHWRYFEIDKSVVEIALDSNKFAFMAPTQRDRITIADARLAMAEVADGSQDLIIIDAFSSDSIPTHLLTVEAMSLYARKLARDGLLFMHVTNRNMELASVVSANAAQIGMLGARRQSTVSDINQDYHAPVDGIILSHDPERLADVMRLREWKRLALNPDVGTWTDDFSNVPTAIYRRLWQKR